MKKRISRMISAALALSLCLGMALIPASAAETEDGRGQDAESREDPQELDGQIEAGKVRHQGADTAGQQNGARLAQGGFVFVVHGGFFLPEKAGNARLCNTPIIAQSTRPRKRARGRKKRLFLGGQPFSTPQWRGIIRRIVPAGPQFFRRSPCPPPILY